MKKTNIYIIVFILTLLGINAQAQMSGSYTVDPSQAASSSNYQDVVSAVFDLTQSSGNRPDGGSRNGPGVSGAVTINIYPGTYKGQLVITEITGASSSNTITFQSNNGNPRSVILTDSAVSQATNGLLKIKGASYINFNKVTFKPLGAMFNFATAIWIDSNGTTTSSYNNFYGCRIGANWGITNKNYSCAYINGYQTYTTFVRDTFYNASCAIYVDGNRNGGNYTEGLLIDSNYFFPNNSDVFQPFYIRYVKDVKISHNHIVKNGCCADRMGQFYGVRVPFEMSYNKFYYQTGSASGNGFDFDSLNLYNDGGIAKIYNNFFNSNYSGSGTMLRLARSSDVSVAHNNFYSTGNNNSFNVFETYATDSNNHNNIEILNNSIITNGAVVLNITGSNLATAKKAISNINFNNIHRPFSNFQVIYNLMGNKINNSSNLVDAIYSGSDASTGFYAAKYVGSNNLHLSNTNCMNGTAISYITDDIDGESRNTPPTIGADEVTNGTIQNDIGIVGVIQPSSSSYSAGSQDIIVLVKNYGSNTVTSFNTKYSMNGAAPVSVAFSGSLATCDTVSIVFTGANQFNFSSGSYYMTVYTDSLNNGVDSNTVNDTIVKTYCVPLSGNYTIDGSSALSSTNFQNFTQLANTLNNCGISGPVNVSVAAGTYSEHIILGAINGNDTNNTITIDGGVNGASTRIIKAKAYNSSVNYLVRLDGVNAIQFRNLTFSSDSGTIGTLLHTTSGTKFQVKKCVFDYNGTAANSTNNNLQAIMISAGYSNQLSAANLLIAEIDSNTFKNGYYGVVANFSNYINTIYLRNNTFTGTYNSCIYVYAGTVKILDNKLEQRSGFGGNGAIYLFNLNPYNANYFNQINNNLISKVSNYGIYVYFCTGGYNSLKGEIYNNMIGGTFMNTGQIAGMYINYSNQWKIYNNSISIASTNASANRGVYVTGYGLNKSQFKNNSIAINTTTANNPVCMLFTDTSFADTNGVNYNNYYNASSADIITVKNTTYDNTNYNAAFPYGGGAQSFDGDPMYNSSTDLHVSGLQLSDRGAALGVTDDFDHQTRSATSPDIGADEFYATTYRDFSMYALLSPVANGGCLGGYNQTITATLANIGVDTIDLTSDTAWVSAKVTNPTGNITTYGPIAITSKIFYPKDTMNIDITYAFDMSDAGTYHVAPYVSFAKDTNIMNDTLMNQYLDANNPVAILSTLVKTSICNGDSVKMSAANSKNVTDFIWFQDGNPLYSSTDSVYYATAVGEYFCMITNNSGCIVTTDTIKITAGSNPTASFTTNKTSFCNGDSAHLSAGVNANYNYQWLYNNNVIAGATDSFYDAKNAGSYTLKAIDKNSSCFDIAAAINLTINASPTATISYTGSNIKCAGDSLKLSSNPASGLTYEWIYNGNTNGATDSFLYVSASGDYQVRITNATGCITTSSASTITFDTLPSTNINITGNTKACGSDSVYLDANSNATFTYEWSNNNTPINGANSSQLLVLANGSYSVKITNSNGCSNISTPIGITFTPYPSAPSLNGNSSSKICNGDSIRISVSAQDTGVFSYQWKLNGNNISGSDSFIYISTAGDYSAQVINNGGCATTSASTINLSLHPTSTPTITASGSTTICAGDSVNLTVSNNNGLTSQAWFLNGNSLNNTNTNVYAKSAGPYTVGIVDNNGCKATSAATNVFVNPAPAPLISNLNATSELTTTVAFSSYQWYLNGNAIAGATTQKIRIFSNGDYTVEVTDANGCKGKSAVNNVTWYVGIKNITTNAYLNVYPNPSHDVFNIELPEGFDAKYITLLDVTGKQISLNLIRSNNNIYTLDLSNQAAGVYLLQYNNNNKMEQVRLIKF